MHLSRASIILGSLLIRNVWSAAVSAPVITPAPNFPAEWLDKRQGVDAIDIAKILLTAIPLSLRQIAVTNLPAVSSILWETFLDDKKPDWFKALPLDVQSYLIVEFGPQTAWPTAPPISNGLSSEFIATTTTETAFSATTSAGVSPSSSIERSAIPTPISTSSSSVSTASSSTTSLVSTLSSPSPSFSSSLATESSASPVPTSDPKSPPASTSGLSRAQKIGLGIGIPLGLLAAAAFLFGCCFFLRRRKRKVSDDGNERPSTPGFIPRFAFHERASAEHNNEHNSPLNPAADQSSYGAESMIWDDEDDFNATSINRGNTLPSTMAMRDSSPIIAPALYHTHSSNRARGKRTSYTSLHSVAEVAEPEEGVMAGQQVPLRPGPQRSLKITMPPVPAAATLKRKPISPSTSPTEYTPYSPDAEAASHSFLRPLMMNSGSSSSGLASSRHTSTSTEPGYQTDISSPTSPLSPKSSGHTYMEDYGPEYQNAYIDAEDGLYGGHRSLAAYPDPTPRRNSKTEWPLKNVVGMGREKSQSTMWDRVYEKHGRYYAK